MAKYKKRKPDPAALNGTLLRKPIKRMFPLFILPTFLAFAIGFIYPFGEGIYLSFCKFTLPKDATFVGFDNYVKALGDSGFRYSFVYTLIFTIVSVLFINVLAFIIAVALTQKMRGANLFRTVFFMPNLIGGIVLGYIWAMIFDAYFQSQGTYLTADRMYGFWGLLILMCWQQIGYMMIIYIAGLQAVPEDIIEAAKIDGASKMQTLFRVTIPNVMPSITICIFLTLTNSFKLFDQNMALTGGAPEVIDKVAKAKIKLTEMLALNIYSTFYISKNSRGTAQAKAVLFFIMVAVIALLQLRMTRSKEVQQ